MGWCHFAKRSTDSADAEFRQKVSANIWPRFLTLKISLEPVRLHCRTDPFLFRRHEACRGPTINPCKEISSKPVEVSASVPSSSYSSKGLQFHPRFIISTMSRMSFPFAVDQLLVHLSRPAVRVPKYVAPFLKRGRNVISVRTTEPFHSRTMQKRGH